MGFTLAHNDPIRYGEAGALDRPSEFNRDDLTARLVRSIW
jgi:hypothetical protein